METFTEWSDELRAALAEPFPSQQVSKKKKGGQSIPFVSWHFYAARLNELVGGGWSMGTPIQMLVGGKLMIGLPVTILGVTRVNFGDENADQGGEKDYGSASTNAFAQAFKRTLSLFGMGLYLYDKEGRIAAMANGNGNGSAPAKASADVVAKIGALMATKQLTEAHRKRLEGKLADMDDATAKATVLFLEKQADKETP